MPSLLLNPINLCQNPNKPEITAITARIPSAAETMRYIPILSTNCWILLNGFESNINLKRNTGGIHYLYYYSLVTLFHHLMPYIIALAVLVVIGVGFALFQNSNTGQESLDTTAIKVEEKVG